MTPESLRPRRCSYSWRTRIAIDGNRVRYLDIKLAHKKLCSLWPVFPETRLIIHSIDPQRLSSSHQEEQHSSNVLYLHQRCSGFEWCPGSCLSSATHARVRPVPSGRPQRPLPNMYLLIIPHFLSRSMLFNLHNEAMSSNNIRINHNPP